MASQAVNACVVACGWYAPCGPLGGGLACSCPFGSTACTLCDAIVEGCTIAGAIAGREGRSPVATLQSLVAALPHATGMIALCWPVSSPGALSQQRGGGHRTVYSVLSSMGPVSCGDGNTWTSRCHCLASLLVASFCVAMDDAARRPKWGTVPSPIFYRVVPFVPLVGTTIPTLCAVTFPRRRWSFCFAASPKSLVQQEQARRWMGLGPS